MTPQESKRIYVSKGQVLSTPPLSVRVSNQLANVYNFFGLYFVSLLSLDPYSAAESSIFNTAGRGGSNPAQNRPRWTGSGPTARGTWGGPRPGPENRRTMGVDDVRAPECGSCG